MTLFPVFNMSRLAPRATAVAALSACLVTAAALSACGGGDSDANGNAIATATTATTADSSAGRATAAAAGNPALADQTQTAALPPQPAVSACDTAPGRRLQVGPGRAYATPSAAAAVAVAGDVVLIQAGDYSGDVAVWPQSNLTLCGSGGRARLFAAGRNAAGKGIWVIQGSNVVVENIEFHDAKVADRNGAGIRAEGNGLTVRNAGFYDNENGILGPNAGELTIDSSEFARNGYGDGYSHNLYVGTASRLTVTYSFFHEAKVGHNLKSRAQETRISHSYFMDGASGTSSYLIDVPNGGVVVLRGNLLQKGPLTQNSNAVSYGLEGLPWAVNTLEVGYNTLVSQRPGGNFFNVATGVQSVAFRANLFAGTNAPTVFNVSVADKTTQQDSVVGTAADIPGASSVTAPNFWPSAALAASLPIQTASDLTYDRDAPAPYMVRLSSIKLAATAVTRSRQLAGALQSPP